MHSHELFDVSEGVFSDVSRPFGSSVYWFGRPNSGAQKRFFNFLFEDFF